MKHILSTSPPNAVTLLTSHTNQLCKVFSNTANGDIEKQDITFGSYFEHDDCELTNITELADLLGDLEKRPAYCLIRGELLPGINPKKVMRRIHKYDDAPAYYRAHTQGRLWACLDFDHVPYKGACNHTDLTDAAEYLVSLLPDEFHEASYVVQWSSSQGLFSHDTLSAHIWFWFTQPHTDGELRTWAEDTQEYVDEALFGPVQPIFTAHPLFKNGFVDPLKGKRTTLVMKRQLAVPMPTYTRPKATRVPHVATYPPRSSMTFEQRLAQIGDHQEGKGFHKAITSAIATYVATHCDLDLTYLKSRVQERCTNALNTKQRNLQYYMSARYLDASIQGAIQKYHRPLERDQYEKNKKYRNEKRRKI
jgi:hypothetical protein